MFQINYDPLVTVHSRIPALIVIKCTEVTHSGKLLFYNLVALLINNIINFPINFLVKIIKISIMAGKWDDLYEQAQEVLPAPIYLSANVVHGFKRGSKELGIPTANLDMDVVNNMLKEKGHNETGLKTGIYYGWAKLGSSDTIHRTVISVGWNPYYKNEKKTLEAHLLSKMDDFYDENLSVLLCGYLRDEANFTSLDDLISCINEDIVRANNELSSTTNGIVKYGTDYSLWKSM